MGHNQAFRSCEAISNLLLLEHEDTTANNKNALTHNSKGRIVMEYRLLGGSGLKVSALSFGTGTFGGGSEFFNFKAWGETDVPEASRLIDICFEAGVNLFDTANVSSRGRSK